MDSLYELETKRPRVIAYWVIIAQLALTGFVSIGVWGWLGGQAAYSALLAGVICAIANGYFAWRVFRRTGARAAKQFVIAFCVGEVMKLFLLGFLFVLALLYLHIAFGPFLLSFIINLMIYWVAPFIIFGFEKI